MTAFSFMPNYYKSTVIIFRKDLSCLFWRKMAAFLQPCPKPLYKQADGGIEKITSCTTGARGYELELFQSIFNYIEQF